MSNYRDKLIDLLYRAKELSSQFSGGYGNEFFSAEEFHIALTESIERYVLGDSSELEKLYIWFLPTSCWDDFIGRDGQDLANEICSIIPKIISK